MYLTLFNSRDCSLPGSSVHGILQARILEWVAIPFSRGSSQPSDQTQVSCISGKFFTIWASLIAQLVKNPPAGQEDPGSIPGSGRSSGEGIGYPLQCSWASLVAQMIKNLPANAGDPGSIPGLGKSPGEWNGNPLQYSCLENPMNRGAWRSKRVGHD